MKILTNTTSSRLGGIEREASELGRFLKENGDHSLFKVSIDPYADGFFKNNEGNLEDYFIGIRDKPGLRRIYNPRGGLRAMKKRMSYVIDSMKKIIDAKRPDIVMVHGSYFVPWCLYQAALEKKVPIIMKYAGVLIKEQEKSPDSLKELFSEIEGSFNNPEIFVVFPSDLTRRTVSNIYGPLKYSSVVLSNGIPSEFFNNSEKNAGKNIGFVGRYDRVKNPEFMFTLARKIKKVDSEVSINIVTDLKRVKRKILGNMVLTSPMANDNLGLFYRKMNLVLSPSRFETFGNVPLEAIASGTPALINNTMGVKEVFHSVGLDDLVADFSDSNLIVEKTTELLRNPPKLRDAIEELKKTHSWNAIFGQYLKICDDVISKAA